MDAACRSRKSLPLHVRYLLLAVLSAPSLGSAASEDAPWDFGQESRSLTLGRRALTSGPQTDAGLPEERFPKIVMLQDKASAEMAQAMCSKDLDTFMRLSKSTDGNITACFLPDACSSVFYELTGFAGIFSDPEINRIHSCFGDRIMVLEDDIQVRKTEHDYSLPIQHGRKLQLSPEEGPNNNPVLQGLSINFQSDASSYSNVGLQSTYFNSSSQPGNKNASYVTGLKVQQLHSAQWNLDRIDQHSMPLDRQFGFGTLKSWGTGRGVTIYVVDSGIRKSHQEFSSWVGGTSRAKDGFNFVEFTDQAEDCDGHGTHVSSTAVGRSVGVAKEAIVVAVRVLNCQGSGAVSNVVAGLNWVAQNAAMPAIVTLSLGIPKGQWSDALTQAVTSLISKYKITTIVAAGNSQVDSCTISPANVPEAITVAATDLSNKFSGDTSKSVDQLYSWDNTGACISVFAPGVDILAACGGTSRCPQLNDSAYTWASGTSMAVPQVAGLAAIFLSNNKNATPAEVKSAIVNGATLGVVDLSRPNVLPSTPNRLINTLATGGQGHFVSATDGPGGD